MKTDALHDVPVLFTGSPLDEVLGTAGDAMTRSVVTVEADLRAADAALLLDREGVSGAPVVREGAVVGVITLRDLLERAAQHGTPHTTGPFLRFDRLLTDVKVEDVMTREVAVVRPDSSLAAAVVLMDEAHVNRLPVVDVRGRPVGILARDDLVKAIASRARAR